MDGVAISAKLRNSGSGLEQGERRFRYRAGARSVFPKFVL